MLEIEIDITFEAKLLFSLHTQMQKSEYYIVLDQSLVTFSLREQNKHFWFYGPDGVHRQSHFCFCSVKAPIDHM